MTRQQHLAVLAAEAAACTACPRMEGRRRVLGAANGPASARVLFVAEAPGRNGADRTGVPLSGDPSGVLFEALLPLAGLARERVFVTNAVLCNPRKPDGTNDRPTSAERARCAPFLARTLDLVDPAVVVTLGAVALAALATLSPHDHRLRDAAARLLSWNGRRLVPLYHPSPRVVAVRGRARLEADWRRLGRHLRRLGVGRDGA